MSHLRFCTEYSIAVGEPLAGWGKHQAKNVLIRWPKGKWRHSLRIAGGMNAQVEAAIARVVEAGWRVNLIDRKPHDGDSIRVFLMPEGLAFDLAPDDLAAFLDTVPRGAASLARFAPQPLDRPLVLCCTHGKHDRCCAKWGFAVYKALAAEAAKRQDFDVWECTHLGGCRLAAGVLTFPAMRKYGRLAPADAPKLLAAEAEGRPYLPCYRGACHLDPAAQVAEVTALQALSPTAPHPPAQVTEIPSSGRTRRFIVKVADHLAEIACHPGSVRSYGACEDMRDAAPPDPAEIWHGDVLSLTRKPETQR
ncbi:sucrase ferredoxin [Aestuariibius sp. 2305UL40-4]|uniref:sucrase ferredoxin n=1 Tax=Aestuariibius violaceus TaxID=3234132 RepID=UPI00345E2071